MSKTDIANVYNNMLFSVSGDQRFNSATTFIVMRSVTVTD